MRAPMRRHEHSPRSTLYGGAVGVVLLLTAANCLGQLDVISPNGGEVYAIGGRMTIRWSRGSPTDRITILLWRDSSNINQYERLAYDLPNTSQQYTWSPVTGPASTHCQIGVEAGGSGHKSHADFTIQQQDPLRILSPNGGEVYVHHGTMTIRWSGGDPTAKVDIIESSDGGTTWQSVRSKTENDGQYEWANVETEATTHCRIGVCLDDAPLPPADMSDADFTVTAIKPTVGTYVADDDPSCGSAWLCGTLTDNGGESCRVRVGYSSDLTPPLFIPADYTPWQDCPQGSFCVTIPLVPGGHIEFFAQAQNSAGTSSSKFDTYDAPDGTVVPNLANMTKSQAQAALQAVGLVLGTVSGDPTGKVAYQSPRAGRQACPDSAVDITLTRREAEVPDVVGMSESEATAALEAAGFLADLSYGPSDEDPGTVFKQDPVGRTVVLEGTEVRLTISQDDDGGPGPGPVPALPTPVAHWKLDESTGTIAHDAAGSHPGALKGNPAWQPSGGKIDGALRFDGVDDYVDTGYTEDLAAWTVSVWVKSPVAPSAGTTTGPVHREQNYQLNWDHGNQAFRGAAGLNVGGTWHAASFGPLTANTWYHLGATYDGQALRSYKNGVAVTTNDAPSGNPRPETASLKLGRHALSPTYFGGTIDDVRIYDEVLNENQIRAVMAGSEAWIPTEGKDIGTPVTGSDSYTGGVYTVVADGGDVWDYRDEFRYVYTAVAGDFEFSARVLNLENTNWWAKAGVMVRETLDPESRHAFMCVTPEDGEGRFAFQCRPETPGLSTSIHSIQGQVAYPTNTWVKIKRQGNAFTALTSQDGTTWTKFTGHEVDLQGYPDAPNPVTIAMPQIVYIGLAVTSHSNGQLCTAEFDNVQLDNPAVTP